jgi:Protein of unknown function (DUF3108)
MKLTRCSPVMIFILWLACCLQPAFAQTVPEKLVYDLSWAGIKVGTAVQEIIEEGLERRITSTARSNAWLSLFLPVDDRIESTLLKSPVAFPGITRHYRMQIREGMHRRDREILFDPAHGTARYLDHLSGERVEIPISANTYDIYGSFYHVRYATLEVGKSIHITVLDDTEPDDIEVRVLKKEKIHSILGDINTIVIKPLVKQKGVFAGKGSVLIWLTDDSRRIPVQVQTKVRVGSVTATLVGGNY